MFRALQHDFGLLLAFFHQQHKCKCSNVSQGCHHPCGRNGWRTVAKSNLNFAAFSHVLLLVFLTCFSRTELMTISFHLEAKFEKEAPSTWQYFSANVWRFFPRIFQIWQICINETQNEKFPLPPNLRSEHLKGDAVQAEIWLLVMFPNKSDVHQLARFKSLTTHSDNKVIWVKYFRSYLKDSPTKHL